MAELRLLTENLGYEQVSTYINSGNLLLSSPKKSPEVAGELAQAIQDQFGFSAAVMVRTDRQLRGVLAGNPYPQGNPSQVMVAFLAGKPAAGATERMTALATADERFTLGSSEAYIDFAGGLARSKLAAQLANAIGTDATTRNVRTVTKLVSLLDD